jgi:hypothetical protein
MIAPVALVADNTSGQFSHARLVSMEGASTTFHVEGMHGQTATVQVPPQSLADVHFNKKTQRTVGATVVSTDRETHRLKVRTHESHKRVLDLSPAYLREIQGHHLMMLVAPWQLA